MAPFRCFATPYVITNGGDGPERSLLFLATYLYKNAFDYWNMGYASAIGIILFLIVILCADLLIAHKFLGAARLLRGELIRD